MKRLVLFLYAIILINIPSSGWATILISEVFYDASGNDTGKEWIELWNNGNSSFNLDGYELNASSGDYYVFSGFILGDNDTVVIHWNTSGVDTPLELYTGTAGFSNMGNTKGWVALFNSSTHSKNTIVDYMEYGDSPNTWEQAAVDAGIWVSGSYAPGVPPGHSLALRYGRSGNKGSDYFSQSNPGPGVAPAPEPPSLLLFFTGLGFGALARFVRLQVTLNTIR